VSGFKGTKAGLRGYFGNFFDVYFDSLIDQPKFLKRRSHDFSDAIGAYAITF
jgi:hypothetical protein